MREKLIKLIEEWKSFHCMNPSTQELISDLEKLVSENSEVRES